MTDVRSRSLRVTETMILLIFTLQRKKEAKKLRRVLLGIGFFGSWLTYLGIRHSLALHPEEKNLGFLRLGPGKQD